MQLHQCYVIHRNKLTPDSNLAKNFEVVQHLPLKILPNQTNTLNQMQMLYETLIEKAGLKTYKIYVNESVSTFITFTINVKL